MTHQPSNPTNGHPNHPDAAPRFVDPVCDMAVDPARSAAVIEYEGKTYYFCRQECANRFRQHPDIYANTGKPLI